MDFIHSIVDSGLFERIVWTIVVLVLSITVYAVIAKILNNNAKKNSKFFSSKKNKTFVSMARNAVGVGITIVATLTIMQIFGVNVTSMLAGVGIVSIVVGFALQDALKDVIRGFEIVSSGYYAVGDYIKYGDNVGEVLSITLNTTRLQDMNTMNIVSIANRNIDQVEIVSEYIYLPVPLPYEIKPTAAETLMKEITEKVSKAENVKTVVFQGLNQIGTSTLNYQLAITCDPSNLLTVKRSALKIVTEVLAAHKLRLPYQHVDIHEK